MKLILITQGYDVDTVTDGQKAIEKIIQMKKEYYDLLITEIRLPGISGPELIDYLSLKDIIIPTLFISGLNQKRIVSEMLNKWCLGNIEKPFTYEEFNSAVASSLKNKTMSHNL